MATFHFNSNNEVRINSPQKPAITSSGNNEAETNYSVWNNQFEDDLGISGDVVIIRNNRIKVSDTNKNGREIIEHSTIFIQYSYEELIDMRDENKLKEIEEKYIKREIDKQREKFPENRYDINIKADGNRLEVYIYDKESGTSNNDDTTNLKEAAVEFISGNFMVLNQVKNPVEFLQAFREQSGGKTMYSYLVGAYNEGKIDKDMLVGRLYTLSEMFTNFEDEYDDSNPDSKLGSSGFLTPYQELLNRVHQFFNRSDELTESYQNNKIDREQVKELQDFIKENYNVELNEIAAAIMLNDKDKYKIYSYDDNQFLDFLQNFNGLQADIDWILEDRKKGEKYDFDYDFSIDNDVILKIKSIVKEKTNVDITDNEAKFIYSLHRNKAEIVKIDMESLKSDCISGEFEYAGYDCKQYLEGILTYSGNGYNDSLESLVDVAQTTEIEYGRYNFDIHKSPVADLVRQSEKMIKDGEKELQVTETEDKIIIKNTSTGKERIIDFYKITSNLDAGHRLVILNALNKFNKISLWEFAAEVQNIDTDVDSWRQALAQYDLENDKISVGNTLDPETLLHEMVHAMMATVIDGVNTSNEPLFQEFVDTFNEEQRVHNKDKQLRNSIMSSGNYNYCAENIHEFAAEAGCLWLSGKSDSEFTIATHFPKSYRLFVQLIEKIRAQETGRSISENS